MKRFIHFIILIVILSILMCGCSKPNGRSFSMTGVSLDDEEVVGQNGSLVLYDNGNGTLTFNGTSSDLKWTENPYEIEINDTKGRIVQSGDTLEIYFDSLGLKLSFSQQISFSTANDNVAISGQAIEGRLYYYSCEGNFSDYENTSISVTGTKSTDSISLYNKAYSDVIPMIILNLEDDNCTGGYILGFPVDQYDVKMDVSTQNKNEVNNTEFLHPEEYIWNKYSNTSEEEEVENLVEVLTISGNVRNSDGGFTYKIVLTAE